MEIVGPLITQGGLGLVAAVALWLYIQERREHREDNKMHREEEKSLQAQIYGIQDARLIDQRETTRDVTEVLQANSQAIRILSEKIEIGKQIGTRH
jgi:hypothetical protein